MGMDGGGGKLPYSYASHQQQQDGKLVKSLSRAVEPRKFGLGLVAGFLLVTCAYFSTAKFDAIHIAMITPVSGNAAGIGSLVRAAADTSESSPKQRLDLGRQEQAPDPDRALAMSEEGSRVEVLEKDDGKPSSSGPDAPLEDTRRGGTFVGDSGDASSVAAAAGGKKKSGEAVPAKGDGDAAALLLPAVVSSEEAANGTQESGGLEDEELQVQDAVASGSKRSNGSAAAAAGVIPSSSNVSSSAASVVHSDPAVLPAPAQQIIPPATQDVKALADQRTPAIPEVKHADSATPAPAREWKPLCDVTSNRRIDWCELDGDVRVVGANATVTLVAPPPSGAGASAFREESWRIKPYPRKADPNAMRVVRVLTVASSSSSPQPACTERHGGVPALVFSERGYTGNYFHAFTDVILPLFLTARRYAGEVVFLVADFQAWWVGKFSPVFAALSSYPLVDLDRDPRVHCFAHVQVGLTAHDDFSIDPRRSPGHLSMLDFTAFMRSVYHLPRHHVAAGGNTTAINRKPRLLVIARARTRRFVNTEEIVRGAERVGFEVEVSEGTHEVAPFAEVANSCDAVVGVHGAGLTNMVFVPTGGVVIQVVPLGGLEFVAGYFRGPSRDMGLKYLEYRIQPEESTLTEQFPRDHPIFTDPNKIKSKGWESLKDAYLDKQDVRLDMKRFRPTLKKAIAHLRKARANGGNGGGN